MISSSVPNFHSKGSFPRVRRENLIGNLYALRGAFLQQWRSVRRTASYANFIIAGIPNVIILAFIANNSDNPVAITYIAVGASLMLVWTNAVFRMGWSLSEERWGGLLDISLISRTPMLPCWVNH